MVFVLDCLDDVIERLEESKVFFDRMFGEYTK